jgi:tetratricopeptide (TPR) repeat protein
MQALSLRKTGKTSQAIYTYEKAMRADPGNGTILNAIADCFISEGQTWNAIKILEGVPLIDNKDFASLKKLAGLYRSVENYDKARAYYSATLKVNPNDMEAEHGIKELDAIKTLKGNFENQ